MGRILACACEDVDLAEIRRAVEDGHRDLESVKRATGLGTGPCQGKSCLALAARELQRLGVDPGALSPFTARPPREPVPLGTLAALDPELIPRGDRAAPPEILPPRPAPAPDLLRALGVGLDWDPAIEAFAPRVAGDGATSIPGLFTAGEVARPVSAGDAVAWGRRAGEAARG